MTTSVARPSTGLSEYRTSPAPFARSRPSFDGPALSPLLYDTSVPSRRSSSHSPPYLPNTGARNERKSSTPVQLPGLAALASIASDVADSRQTPQQYSQSHATAMSYATSAPGQNLPGQQPGPPVCQNCSTQTTPLWRRDDNGNVLCNACGLFLKLHGKARPISLKTDVIKSRNRVKGPVNGSRKKQANISPAPGPLTATHPDAHGQRVVDGSPRAETPSQFAAPHASNIAPQHMFDNNTVHSFGSGSTLPRIHSPTNGGEAGAQLSYEALLEQNNRLKTRVSELEVINDLFRGRVAELERAESDARRQIEELRRNSDSMIDHALMEEAATRERQAGEKRDSDAMAAADAALVDVDVHADKRRRTSEHNHEHASSEAV